MNANEPVAEKTSNNGWNVSQKYMDLPIGTLLYTHPVKEVIFLTKAELESGFTRVQWAEALIKQLPEEHEGRNSWLLNYGEEK
jgi:hypothetical protein